MKKTVYIILFVFLGVLAQFLLHAAIEIPYINLLLSDFPKFSFGLSWRSWELIHHIGTVVLLLAGALIGFWQGKLWWRKIYEKDINK